VRIVAATNRDLKKEAHSGRFRQDLFYRLRVFPLDIPPLRERRQDIPLLTANFIKLIAKKMNRPQPRLTKAQVDLLSSMDWLGNVRELQNTIERAMILSQGPKLDLEALLTPNPGHVRPSESLVSENPQTVVTRDDWKRLEKEIIENALKRSDYKIFGESGAASILKMNPTTLLSRMKALGLKSRAR